MLFTTEKAVVDRIVDGRTAVILVGEDERQHHYPADKLPEGVQEGTWLRVRVEGSEIVTVEVDAEETEAVRKRIQNKMNRLRARGRRAS